MFQLSDGAGMAVTIARYETPAHINIDKVLQLSTHHLLTPFNFSPLYWIIDVSIVFTIHDLAWCVDF